MALIQVDIRRACTNTSDGNTLYGIRLLCLYVRYDSLQLGYIVLQRCDFVSQLWGLSVWCQNIVPLQRLHLQGKGLWTTFCGGSTFLFTRYTSMRMISAVFNTLSLSNLKNGCVRDFHVCLGGIVRIGISQLFLIVLSFWSVDYPSLVLCPMDRGLAFLFRRLGVATAHSMCSRHR
jgi:hypothetical protein